MKRFVLVAMVAVLVFEAASAWAADTHIVGAVVTHVRGRTRSGRSVSRTEPIRGATVSIEGSARPRDRTNSDGVFYIGLPSRRTQMLVVLVSHPEYLPIYQEMRPDTGSAKLRLSMKRVPPNPTNREVQAFTAKSMASWERQPATKQKRLAGVTRDRIRAYAKHWKPKTTRSETRYRTVKSIRPDHQPERIPYTVEVPDARIEAEVRRIKTFMAGSLSTLTKAKTNAN